MTYAIVVDGNVSAYGTLQFLFPNVSFPASGPDAVWLAENNAVPVQYQPASYDENTQKVVPVAPFVAADGRVLAYAIEPLSADEITAQEAVMADYVRSDRNNRLQASDWTQLQDASLTEAKKSLWTLYRQDLRNIPQQPGFPFSVTWPTAPKEIS